MLPKSNWVRYFKELVSIDGSEFEKNWRLLYELRCRVAHNNSFTDRDLSKLQDLIAKIEPVIDSFIKELINIHIPEDDKEFIIIHKEATEAVKSESIVDTLYLTIDRLNNSYEGGHYDSLIKTCNNGLSRYQGLIESAAQSETIQAYLKVMQSPSIVAYQKAVDSIKFLENPLIKAAQAHSDILNIAETAMQRRVHNHDESLATPEVDPTSASEQQKDSDN